MCGIAGIIALDQSVVTAGALTAMAAAIRHRGPDGSGTLEEGAVGFAHRRLSILDLDGGMQPMASTTGRTAISYNGEIYNYRELMSELTDYRFATRCDTEVVLAAYERWGVDSFQKFEGMFAFALLDRREQCVYLVRDAIGIKPLYYACVNSKLYFGSEIKAILAALDRAPSLRADAVNGYFARQYIGHEMTIYEGIDALAPGSYLRIDLATGVIKQARFWELSARPSRGADVNTAVAELEPVLSHAAQSHLMADVPVGLFLSGGLDSTTLLALASHGSDRPLLTFSVSFNGTRFDESSFARQAATHFGTEHHELAVNADSALEELPHIITTLDQPLADYAILPTFIMSKFAAERVKVVLGGEGADEVFGGYFWRYLPHLMAERAGGVVRPRTLTSPMLFSNRMRRQLLGDAFEPLTELASERCLRDDLQRYGRDGLLNAALLTDMRHWLPDDLLAKVDNMGMLASLEARVPYLDRRVIELAASWPSSVKLGLSQTKIALRNLAGRLVPGALAARKKHGFTVPVADWLRGKLKPRFEDIVLNGSRSRAWLEKDAIETLWREHQRGRDHGLRLWSILVFAWWLEHRTT
jgi:asparagine synthase (glutamine-hydrolysing)